MPTKNNPSTQEPSMKVVVTRVFLAPCDMVFKAWTDPKQMVQWWSPKGVECRSVTAEVKIGGAYRIHMVPPNDQAIAYGKYTQIVPNQLLQFTWEWEERDMPQTLVTVKFEDLGKTTRLTLTHEGFVEKEDADDHNNGWSSAIEKFAELIEQNKIQC